MASVSLLEFCLFTVLLRVGSEQILGEAFGLQRNLARFRDVLTKAWKGFSRYGQTFK
jgi:hypothetical protein